MAVKVLSDFLIASVQDMGRTGYAAYGYRQCGACDKYAMVLANLLCGNIEDCDQAAVIEMALAGGSFEFTCTTVFSITGADVTVKLDDRIVPSYQGILAKKGQVLTISQPEKGFRTYLAVYGGICVPKVLGSRSTDATCGIGGYEGRNLQKGDQLPTQDASDFLQHLRKKKPDLMTEEVISSGLVPFFTIPEQEWWLKRISPSMRSVDGQLIPVLRVVAGPQEELFTREGRDTFWRRAYKISAKSNRMACRMEGEKLETLSGSDIISDAIVEGSVQVASDGMPIVMQADHQTTGGYAKIGTVIRPDLSLLAQKKPGDLVGFSYVTVEEARELFLKEAGKIRKLKTRFLQYV